VAAQIYDFRLDLVDRHRDLRTLKVMVEIIPDAADSDNGCATHGGEDYQDSPETGSYFLTDFQIGKHGGERHGGSSLILWKKLLDQALDLRQWLPVQRGDGLANRTTQNARCEK
jgi:hypothetical protein